MADYDATCNPALESWVASANLPSTDFPLQNLPLGIFRNRNSILKRIGVAIGDQVLDLQGIAGEGMLAGLDAGIEGACASETLNALMALGPQGSSALRARLSELLRANPLATRDHAFERVVEQHLLPQKEVQMLLPAAIGDYTDFYASLEHATRVGAMLRPERPLLPNYKHIPIGYHGRASSMVVSGTAIRRPHGQQLRSDAAVFAPTANLDFEAELGFFVGRGNALGTRVAIGEAREHLFGCCLVNDWSARDLQTWEYQPLGPFLGKSFATSLSPWVVTMEALAPFRVAARERGQDDPAVLAYLVDGDDEKSGAFDITIEARLLTGAMRDCGLPPMRLALSDTRELYWTPAQMLAHHTSNGCNLRPGDLLATGTVSGKEDSARACLLELTRRGSEPVELPHGEQRRYLEDGDELILTAYCAREGARRIGFGECRGIVMAAG